VRTMSIEDKKTPIEHSGSSACYLSMIALDDLAVARAIYRYASEKRDAAVGDMHYDRACVFRDLMKQAMELVATSADYCGYNEDR